MKQDRSYNKLHYNILILALGLALGLTLAPSATQAAVSATHLTTGGDGSQQLTYTTASITPAANQLILAWIMNSNNNPVDIPTLSGNGLTWVQVNNVAWNTTASPTYRITLFRAMGAAPTAGSVSINYPNKQRSAAWSIIEFSGVDTSGTDGSAAVIQSATGSDDGAGPAGLTITLPSAIGSGNATAGGFGNDNIVNSISPGTGYTAFPEINVGNPHLDLRAEWRSDGNTTVNATQSGSNPMAGIAVEVGTLSLPLVKQVWNSSGTNCLASSPADATCNGGATTTNVPTGTTLKLLIFVRNATDINLTDVRFSDALDVSGTGFTYVAGSIRRTQTAIPPSDTATNTAIFNDANGGTGIALTDALTNADVAAFVSPNLTVGGDGTASQNATLAISARTSFGVIFQATKN